MLGRKAHSTVLSVTNCAIIVLVTNCLPIKIPIDYYYLLLPTTIPTTIPTIPTTIPSTIPTTIPTTTYHYLLLMLRSLALEPESRRRRA